jgi:hypothetical protein
MINKILFVLIAFYMPLTAQEMAVPTDMQAALFKKIFSFDKSLSGTPKVLVLHTDASSGVKDQVIKSFGSVGITAEGIKSDQLAGSVGANTVVYVAPGASSPKALCSSKKALSISGVASLAESGQVSVAIGVEGGKPKIIVNMSQLKAEGHDLSADLLKLAKVIQ